MTPVPLDLPLRPSEAAELAGLIFESAERKPLTDETRNRVAARAAGLRFGTITPYFRSLERDPVHHSTYYMAVDVEQGPPLLLHMAPATAPTSSMFHKPLLIGRMHRSPGPEIVINAIPFGPADCDALDKFATHIDQAFLPRPHGSGTTIVAGVVDGVFETFRGIQKRTGRNVAAIGWAGDGAAGAAYYAALWGAIRSGWRNGYSAVARITSKEAVAGAALFSTFAFDPSALIREAEAQEPFEAMFSAEERNWIVEEFQGAFAPADVVRLAVRWGGGLVLGERVHSQIRQTRSALKINRAFNFELALDRVPSTTTPEELTFCLQWLKARGHAAQLAAPHLQSGDEPGVRELAAICRHFQCSLDFPAESAALVETVARATGGRVTCSLWGPQSIDAVAEALLG